MRWCGGIRKFAVITHEKRVGSRYSLDHLDSLEDSHNLKDAKYLSDAQNPRVAVERVRTLILQA